METMQPRSGKLVTLLALAGYLCSAGMVHAAAVPDWQIYCEKKSMASLLNDEQRSAADLYQLLGLCLGQAAARQLSPALPAHQERLARLLAVHAIINAPWEAAYAASLNASSNASREHLRQDVIKANMDAAFASSWHAARSLIKSGYRRFALAGMLRETARVTAEYAVDDAFGAAVPVCWRVTFHASQAGQEASLIGKLSFAAAERTAVIYLITHPRELWDLAYSQAREQVAKQAGPLSYLFLDLPASAQDNAFFAPFAPLLTAPQALVGRSAA